jgi:hypothetical protein
MVNEKQPRTFTIEALAEFVAAEVEQILVQYDANMRKPTVITGGYLAGSVVSAFAGLSLKQQEALSKLGRGVSVDLAALVLKLAKDAMGGLEPDANQIGGVSEDQPAAPVSIKVNDWAGPAVGSTQLEAEYGVNRSTLYRLQRRNAVIALRTGGRKHVFPLAQFVDGRPVAGLDQISSILSPPRVAWFWLTRRCEALEGVTPLELLKADRVDEVVAAARKHVSTPDNQKT